MEQKEQSPRNRARAKVSNINWPQLGLTLAGYAFQGLVVGASSALGARLVTPAVTTNVELAANEGVVTSIRAGKVAGA